jgi:predicted dehydrogenase
MKRTNKITDLKGLVIGCGSIGERHVNNLIKLGIKNIAICDKDKKKVDELSLKYKTQKFYEINSALSTEPNFSFICTYPDSHIQIANSCISANSHLFIEKPISSKLDGVERMLKKAQSKKLKVAVGYNMRFEQGLQIIKNELKRNSVSPTLSIFSEWGHNIKFWRPGTNYKNHYVLKKGSGIILDDSHEYDYMRWLLDDDAESVYCQTQKMKSVKTETESLASIMIKFKKGTVGSLLIDYVRPSYQRRCHIIGEKGDIEWTYYIQKGSWNKYSTRANSSVTINLNSHLIRKNFSNHSNRTYVMEDIDFIKSIIDNKEPVVNGWEGFKTLQIGIAALESSKKKRVIYL